MSIDSIGKSGGLGGIPPAAITPGSEVRSSEAFHVQRTAAPSAVVPTSPLERLKAGQIDRNQYLDLRIDQATSHLEGKLDTERLQFIKEALRSQLETDPMLVELVAKATSGAFDKPADRG